MARQPSTTTKTTARKGAAAGRRTDRANTAPAVASDTGKDPHAAPDGADVSYIAEPLRVLAVRADSLTMDPCNVKDHGDIDLPAHMASLREFGICRAVIVRRENRQIIAGNGTVMAVLRNGWEYVPAAFLDVDQNKARALALADNAVGSLAVWNELNLAKLRDESPALFESPDLAGLAEQVLAQLEEMQDTEDATENPAEDDKPAGGDMLIEFRVIAKFDSLEKQREFALQLEAKGIDFSFNQVRLK